VGVGRSVGTTGGAGHARAAVGVLGHGSGKVQGGESQIPRRGNANGYVTDAWGHDSLADFYTGVFRPRDEEVRLKAPSQQGRQKQLELTSRRQETQLRVLGTLRSSLYTYRRVNKTKRTLPRTSESPRLQTEASYKDESR
jgi:hypothetical protein